ncbi:Glutathione S-transferase [Hondaea fermentalgiana]|uniref:Glutathione S-transferase n=1 Tax=Hondaea fermentalgiana TaxID=2315210 RepID=A0A2R5GHA3_9STRA|nr:Glutathione S-transferase [Hondaea fermentalgiana]|eukprot:GBG30260.1 Glutathione S-transferase [Hondaea fermentalgiana]
MAKIKLTYFDLEAKAEKVRLALVLNGVDFEDVRLTESEWQDLKPKTKFGQIPLMELEDGSVYAQSYALLNMAAKMGAAKLIPQDPVDQLRVDEALHLADDIFRSFEPALFIALEPEKYGRPKDFPDTDEGKATIKAMREKWVAEELPKLMKMVTALLEANGADGFLATKKVPSIADCHMVSLLRTFQHGGYFKGFPQSNLDDFDTVTAYMGRFLSIPEISAWYSKRS